MANEKAKKVYEVIANQLLVGQGKGKDPKKYTKGEDIELNVKAGEDLISKGKVREKAEQPKNNVESAKATTPKT